MTIPPEQPRDTTVDPLLAPPVTPADAAAAGDARHAADDDKRLLVGPSGEALGPLPISSGPTGPALATRIKGVDDRHRLNATFLAAGIVAVLLFVILLAFLLHGKQNQLDELSARTVHNATDDTRTGQAVATQRVATCREAEFLLGLPTSTRVNWPAGRSSYDATVAALRQSAVDLGCPGI